MLRKVLRKKDAIRAISSAGKSWRTGGSEFRSALEDKVLARMHGELRIVVSIFCHVGKIIHNIALSAPSNTSMENLQVFEFS